MPDECPLWVISGRRSPDCKWSAIAPGADIGPRYVCFVLSGDMDATGWGRCHGGKGAGRSLSMRRRIFRNSSLGTAISASWKVTYRPWLTTFAPTFTGFSRSVLGDHSMSAIGYKRRFVALPWHFRCLG